MGSLSPGTAGRRPAQALIILVAWRWTALETSISPTAATTASARWIRLALSRPLLATGGLVSLGTLGRRPAHASIILVAWRWTALETSISPTVATNASGSYRPELYLPIFWFPGSAGYP